MRADVLFNWYGASPAFNAVVATATRPLVVIGMAAGPGTDYAGILNAAGPNPLRSLAMQRLGGDLPYRIGLVGFSHGCQGVRAALQTGDGAMVDAVYCCDGIHTDWTNQAAGQMNAALLAPYYALGRLAVPDGRVFAITTSAIVPPSYVSTTATSNWLWQTLTGSTSDSYDTPPLDAVWNAPVNFMSKPMAGHAAVTYTNIPWVRYRKSGGLVIYNAKNLDPTGVGDHQLQAGTVLPLVVQAYVINRWNAMDPTIACP
jgi:hypothetical protein